MTSRFAIGLRSSIAVACLTTAGFAHAAINLPSYNVDTSKTTVSGLSSGGFMANQLGIAYSSPFKGVRVFAPGPYKCAGVTNTTARLSKPDIFTTHTHHIPNHHNTHTHPPPPHSQPPARLQKRGSFLNYKMAIELPGVKK